MASQLMLSDAANIDVSARGRFCRQLRYVLLSGPSQGKRL